MSNNYDVLLAVVLRLPSERGTEIFQNIDEILKKIGDSIAKEYEDFGVYPLGMELVQPDQKPRILNRLKYDEDAFENEVDEDETET